MSTDFSISDPQAIAKRGEEIYQTKYKELERENTGRFIAIDVATEESYVGDTSEQALQKARDASPEGLFHLIQIGHRGAYRVSYSLSETGADWIFGLTAKAQITVENESRIGIAILEPKSSDVLIGMEFLRLFEKAFFIVKDGVILLNETFLVQIAKTAQEQLRTQKPELPVVSSTPQA